MMEATEKTEVLKGLVVETRNLSENRIRDKITPSERETVRTELTAIAERLVNKFALSIPDVRRILHELLDVSV
jgi:hypothetical protein